MMANGTSWHPRAHKAISHWTADLYDSRSHSLLRAMRLRHGLACCLDAVCAGFISSCLLVNHNRSLHGKQNKQQAEDVAAVRCLAKPFQVFCLQKTATQAWVQTSNSRPLFT